MQILLKLLRMVAAMFALAGMLMVNVDIAAAELAAREIMGKNYMAGKIKTLKSELTMLLISEKGQNRERRITNVSALQKNGIDSNLLMKFLSPADVKGTSFLQIEHSEGDDDIWIYLPALKKSRRLVANNKRDSFMGSDFSYGDIMPPKIDMYKHTLQRSEAIDGWDCYVIESVPRDEAVKRDHGYGKKATWVRKDNFLEMKVIYYDTSQSLLKTQIVKEHKLMEPENNRWLALRREMVNHQTGHQTSNNFDRLEANYRIPDNFFSQRTIERE
jgi:hypothetical protein